MRPKIIYIMGASRSGSTLLSQILGGIERFENIGEFALARVTTVRELPCSCGNPVEICPYWATIPLSQFSQDLREKTTKILRIRRSVLHIFQKFRDQNEKIWEKIALDLAENYKAISEQTNAEVIIDSSKDPMLGYILQKYSRLDVTFIHLIRKPSSFIKSWTKPKGYLPADNRLVINLFYWCLVNLLAESISTKGQSCLIIAYEKFVQNPRKYLQVICRQIGVEDPDLRFMEQEKIEIGVQHLMLGNPDKFHADNGIILTTSQQTPNDQRSLLAIMADHWFYKKRYLKLDAHSFPVSEK